MSPFRLRLLGGFALHDAAGMELRLPTRKSEALLAFLALESRQPHARESLAAMLWGESSEQSALASLRQTLSLIGKACGRGLLVTEGRTVALARGALELDVARLIALAPPGIGARGASEAAVAATMPVAAEIYPGEVLAGLAIAESAYDEWLHPTRQRVREQAIGLLTHLAQTQLARGQTGPGVVTCLRLLEIEPLLEAGHRILMQCYAQQGRRSAALRQYQVCVNDLQRELNTEPEFATRDLYNALLRQQHGETDADAALPVGAHSDPAPAGAGTSTLVAPVHEARLIGRKPELARLVATLDAARARAGHTMAVLGEAGLGKTRLLEETVAQATAQGVRVLIGHGHESQQLFPLAPWVELLRAAGVGSDPAALMDLGAAWRTELANLLPELGVAELASDDDGMAPARQARLFEAIVQWLAMSTLRVPTLLLIEDLHWLDETSLRLLSTVARRSLNWTFSMIVTARDEAVQADPALRRTLRDLAQGPRFHNIALEALSQHQTAELVSALLRSGADVQASARLADRIWLASEGNPFVVVETMRHLAMDVSSDGALPLPDRVRDLINGHLDCLGPAARKLVTVAAVAGRETDFHLLQLAAGQSEQVAAESLEELVRRRVLRLAGEAFDFTHARIRQTVLDDLLPPSRRALHLSIAQSLEQLNANRLAAVSDALAYHYSHTLHHAKAVAYLGRLSLRAAHDGAHGEAIKALDQALDHLAQAADAGLEPKRRELVLRKARSLFFLGKFSEVLALLAPERPGIDAAGDARMAAAYYLRLGSTQTYLGGHHEAMEYANRALQEATACDDRATMGKAHFLLALESFWADPAQGVLHGEHAVALLQDTPDRWWLGQASWILGLNLSYRGRFHEALAMEAHADALARQTDDRRLASYAAWTTGFIQTLAGDLDPAVTACRRSVDLALDPLNRMTSLGMLALALVERGDWVEASTVLDEAIPQAVQFRIPQMHGLFLAFRGDAALQAGRLDDAQAMAAQGAVITREAGYVYGLGWAQRVLARIALAREDNALAQSCLIDAIHTFDGMGAPYEAARTRLEWARLLKGWHRAAEARPLAQAGLAALEAMQLHAQAARLRVPGLD